MKGCDMFLLARIVDLAFGLYAIGLVLYIFLSWFPSREVIQFRKKLYESIGLFWRRWNGPSNPFRSEPRTSISVPRSCSFLFSFSGEWWFGLL